MVTKPERLANILVPTDFSETARACYPCAAALARKFEGTVHIVHVEQSLPFLLSEEEVDSYTEELKDGLQRCAQSPVLDDVSVMAHLLREGSTADVLEHFVEEHAIDLIIASTHGRTGIEREMLGSFTERLVRTATVPVLVHRQKKDAVAKAEIQNALVPFDFSPEARLVLPIVRFLSENFSCRFVFYFVHETAPRQFPYYKTLHALTPKASERAKEHFQALAESELAGVDAVLETAEGVPQFEIIARLKKDEFDLALLSTHGMPRSVAQNVLRGAPCSVLITRQKKEAPLPHAPVSHRSRIGQTRMRGTSAESPIPYSAHFPRR